MDNSRACFTIICRTKGETTRLARELARSLNRGDTLLLQGRLGAGKTTFVQGIANGLGIQDQVTSPTFTISQEYLVPTDRIARDIEKLIHVDLYRLDSADLEELGLEEKLSEGLTVIEWAERIPDRRRFITDNDRLFNINIVITGQTREFVFDVPIARYDHLRSILIKAQKPQKPVRTIP